MYKHKLLLDEDKKVGKLNSLEIKCFVNVDDNGWCNDWFKAVGGVLIIDRLTDGWTDFGDCLDVVVIDLSLTLTCQQEIVHRSLQRSVWKSGQKSVRVHFQHFWWRSKRTHRLLGIHDGNNNINNLSRHWILLPFSGNQLQQHELSWEEAQLDF